MKNDKQKDLSFIVKGKYPSFIKEHPIVTNNGCSPKDKIFPLIGLPNSSEEVHYKNKELHTGANQLIHSIKSSLYSCYGISTIDAEYQKILKKIFDMCSVRTPEFLIECDDGRLEIKIPADVVVEGKVIYKKGKPLFRIYNSIAEELEAKFSHKIPVLETMPDFKAFSSINIPGTKCKVVFSSTGEDGYWDIATISMRGIASCQSWDKPQSRALISAMTSKFAGVIYLTTNNPFNEYGSRMIRRAMVKYCVSHKTKKPGLVLDSIYPSYDLAAAKIFADFLNKKTNLPVFVSGYNTTSGPDNDRSHFLLPQERTWEKYPLANGETFYMDHQITTFSSHKRKATEYYANELFDIDRIINEDIKSHLILRDDINKNTNLWYAITNSYINAIENFSYGFPATNIPTKIEYRKALIRKILMSWDSFKTNTLEKVCLVQYNRAADYEHFTEIYYPLYKQAVHNLYKTLLKK